MIEKIAFTTDDGTEVLFSVLEETKVNGIRYLLVSENEEEEEAECLILKDTSKDSEEIAVYEVVDDDETLAALGKIFSALLDTEITKED